MSDYKSHLIRMFVLSAAAVIRRRESLPDVPLNDVEVTSGTATLTADKVRPRLDGMASFTRRCGSSHNEENTNHMKSTFSFLLAATAVFAQAPALPITGRDVPALVSYENALRPIMQKWAIPGAALAITDGGRLVYARGFGYADKEAGIPVQPGSLFRLASISKTLTGMTIVKLAEEGRLNLDAKFMDLVPNVTPIATLAFDARMRNITVRMLLQHTGGWNKDVPSDWVLQFAAAAKALSVPYATLTPDMMCRYAVSQRLDFDPGTRYAYSQSGYLILGRIIEKITGKKYEDAVREKLLTPAGVATLKIGHGLLSQKEPDEVKYYDYPGAPLQTTTPAVPGAAAPTPRQYGSYWVEQAEAYGGWVGNAIDLMRYINALEGRRGPPILSPASLAAIVARPSITPTGEFVSLTWRIDQLTGGGAHWWHSGGAIGTRNILARRQNNKDWVVLMNSRPLDEETIITEIFNAFAKAETQVSSWPTNDLFSDFGGPTLATGVQSLAFNFVLGNAPPEAQTLQVTAAPSAVDFTITGPGASWLSVDRLAGATPTAVRVSVDPTGLQAGSYAAVITISAPQSANGSRSVPVTLIVTAVPGFTAIRNSASLRPVTSAAPASRITVDAPGIATVSTRVDGIPDPGPLNGVTVKVTGSDAVEVTATIVEVTPTRVDIAIPDGIAPGDASIAVTTSAGLLLRDRLQIESVSPALFTANGDGAGAPLAQVLTVDGDGNATATAAYECSAGPGACTPIPIDLGPASSVVSLQLNVTGVRSQTDPTAFGITIGDQTADVIAIEFSSTAAGVDLVTVRLPRSLAGQGDLDLTLTVGGKTSNPVRISVL